MKITMLLGRVYVFVLCALVLGVGVSSGRVMASAVELDLAPFAKGTHLITLGRYDQAAEQWHRLSLAFLSAEAKLGRKKMWQYAGMSEALAAMAADKANSAVAYQYWADSTRYLMTGGTDWQQMRKKMHRRYEQANTLLSTQLQVADLVSSVDHAWQQELTLLQVWDEKLALFSFSSPQLGLSDNRNGSSLRATNEVTDPPPARYIRPAPSATGKKLSGINTDFSHEKKVRSTTVPITGPDEDMSSPEPVAVTDRDDASVLPVPRDVLTVPSSVNKEVNTTVNQDVAPLLGRRLSNSKVSVSTPSEPPQKPALTPIPAPNVDPKVIVSPVKPIMFKKEANLISGEIVNNPSLSDEQFTTSGSTVKAEKGDKAAGQPDASLSASSIEQGEAARGVVSRGNLEAVEDTGVEALRRRSFVPVVSETDSKL
ncbi:hypothetical protein L4C36_01905 [Photobacterium japonica]|uniref:hypothetical protein n=1 Tax=Photobacterium japonica TaxID=2910235 RepID=UPI003D10F51B